MGKINKKAIGELQGNSSSTVKKNSNLGKSLVAIGLTATLAFSMVAPALAHESRPNRTNCNEYRSNHTHDNDCGYYSYVPYNKNWGIKDATYLECVSVTKNGTGVARISETSSELSSAINKCLGKKKVADSGYKYVTFDINYKKENDSYIIDIESFEFYKKNISNLGRLSDKNVYLPCKVFVSPEGQQWVDEENYIEYIKGQVVVYECSDGTLVNSYQQFKDWERELVKKPNNPNRQDNKDQNISLGQIAHFELSTDGTIWKDMTILEEYLCWKEDNSYGYKKGMYYGVYGTSSSFIEYVKCYNNSYFINSGLKRSEQYYGANGFLYANSEQAEKSLEKGFQKFK